MPEALPTPGRPGPQVGSPQVGPPQTGTQPGSRPGPQAVSQSGPAASAGTKPPLPPAGANLPAPARPVVVRSPQPAATPARRPVAAPSAVAKRRPRVRMRFRLLPVTIFAAVLMLGARLFDLWSLASRGQAPLEMAALQAQTPPGQGKSPPAPAGEPKPPAKGDPAKPAKPAAGAAPAAAKPPVDEDAEPPAAKLTVLDTELVKQLSARREELEQRSRNLDQREALVAAAEKRLEQKMGELQAMRGEIQALLRQVDDTRKAQLESLVRIYETMKPKEAARIFEAMDQPVLLDVAERMKESKMAPILAAMDPVKAKELTTALADRRRLPGAPP